jgi:DNA-binding NarL/FixJ family response regulator
MKRNIIYFIDEDPAARRANRLALTELFANPELKVRAIEPRKNFADYNELVAQPTTASFILDQRMKGSGFVNYNGIDLARHLRRLDGKMPIYILTGYENERQDFDGAEYLVEYIIGKHWIDDPNSKSAQTVKARILRHLNVFNDVREEQEERFNDLILKSLNGELTPDEQLEMDKIEGVTTAPIIATERSKERELAEKIAALDAFIKNAKS